MQTQGAAGRNRHREARHAIKPAKLPLVGIIILVAVVLLLGGVVGAYFFSNTVARSTWSDLVDSQGCGETPSDKCVGVLTIPSFGSGYAVPIVKGTDPAALRQGVGWYGDTAAPGQVGNFAIAGYRLGWGQPFAGLDGLRLGDEIIVNTPAADYTYTVITAPTSVSDDDTDVLGAVPGAPGRIPTDAFITVTTAGSPLPSPVRLVVVGELTAVS